jgi:uncharacterized membrane protein YgcG
MYHRLWFARVIPTIVLFILLLPHSYAITVASSMHELRASSSAIVINDGFGGFGGGSSGGGGASGSW